MVSLKPEEGQGSLQPHSFFLRREGKMSADLQNIMGNLGDLN